MLYINRKFGLGPAPPEITASESEEQKTILGNGCHVPNNSIIFVFVLYFFLSSFFVVVV